MSGIGRNTAGQAAFVDPRVLPVPLAVRTPFGERLRLMRSKRNEDWWHIVFGGPVGTFLSACIAEVEWITPNLLTWLSFVAKLIAVPLLLARSGQADIAAAVILQVNTVLDVMDGALARYRKQSSLKGAFLDKVTDAVGLAAVCGALTYRVFLDRREHLALLAGFLIIVTYLTRIYIYWVVAYFEGERKTEQRTAGPSTRKDFGDLTYRERMIYYVKSTPRILLVGEGDMYFWISLALIFGHHRNVLYFLAVALTFWLGVMGTIRFRAMCRLDAQPAPADSAPGAGSE